MRKYRLAVFYIGLLIGFLGCRHPVGTNDDPLTPSTDGKTYVRFKNQNDFSVTIYRDSSRSSALADIEANASSDPIEVSSGISEAQYYPQYKIIVEDILILFDGDSFFSGIEKDKRNEVEVPSLTELSPSKFITDKVYIKIENKSSFPLLLQKGAGEINPHDAASPFLNGFKTGLYIVEGGSVSGSGGYSFRKNATDPIEFPSNVTELIAGHLYFFRYEGSDLQLITDKTLTIAETITLLPPQNITARALSSSSIKITWDRAGAETSYKIYRTIGAPQSASNYALVGTSDTTSYTDTAGLTAGIIYYYRLKSVKNNLESELSSTWASVRPAAGQLSPPEDLSAVVQSSSSIKLSWNSVSTAEGYAIYQGNDASEAGTLLDTTADTHFTVIGLEPNTFYYFRVSAFDLNTKTALTGAVPVRTSGLVGDATGIGGLFLAPSNLNAAVDSSSQITVSWDSVTGAAFYEVYRTASSGGSYTLVSGAITGNSYTDTGLISGTGYYYKVRAYIADGTKASNLSFTAASAVTQAPPAPLDIYATAQSVSSIYISWSAIDGATGYNLYRSTNASGVYTKVNSSRIDGTVYTDTGLISATSYYYKAASVSGGDTDGEQSVYVSAQPLPGPVLYDGVIDTAHTLGSFENIDVVTAYLSSNVVSGHSYYIVLHKDESTNSIIFNYPGKTVGITFKGDSVERTINLNSNGSLFTVNSGVTLSLENNITLQGRSTNAYSLINVSSGILKMNDGAKISGNKSDNGGGVLIGSSGTFTMSGGEISGNTASGIYPGGGGVYVSGGTFTMTGGKIKQNTVSGSENIYGGGGVCVISGGTFSMSGGEISGNIATSTYTNGLHGGGVWVYNSTFAKSSGGIIYGSDATDELRNTSNSSSAGHAVYDLSGGIRNTTAGVGVTLDSTKSGAAGGWE